MTKTEMLALIEKQLVAYNQRNLDLFCECYHSDIEIYTLTSGAKSCSNLAQFREGYLKLFSSSPQLHCEIKNRAVLEATVIDEEWITGAAKYPDGLHTVVTYAFKDGLIQRIWISR